MPRDKLVVAFGSRIMADAEAILNQLLVRIADERQIKNPQIQTKSISSGGANYTSQLFLATVKDDTTELNLFAKVAAVGEKFRSQTPMRMFDTENLFYTKLAKVYNKLQEKHNVRDEHKFSPPEFYGCSDKLMEEVIVLEDLVHKGYKVYNRLKSIDWEYASKAVEELAKFHALSFAFKKEDPEEFEKYIEDFKYVWKNDNSSFLDGAKHLAYKAVYPENKERLMKFLDKYFTAEFREFYKPLRGSVLTHGDNRVSNQMYRKDEDGRLQVRIVDYQTMQGASPVIDLLYFIFTGSDEAFRAEYYDKLLDHYYNELSLAMKRLGLNPDEVYSREDFYFEYKEKLPFGLSIAVFTLPVVTVDAENAPKIDEDMDISCFKVEKTSDLFPERLNGIINDFIRWGVM